MMNAASGLIAVPDNNQNNSFSQGVQFADVANQDDQNWQVIVPGTGTITLISHENENNRIGVRAGTKINVKTKRLSPWDGTWWPMENVLEDETNLNLEVGSAEIKNQMQVSEEETQMRFAPAAYVAIDAENISEGHLACLLSEVDGEWVYEEDNCCLIEDGICMGRIKEAEKIALVEVEWDECPLVETKYGTPTENCTMTCELGAEFDQATKTCDRNLQMELEKEDLEKELDAEVRLRGRNLKITKTESYTPLATEKMKLENIAENYLLNY